MKTNRLRLLFLFLVIGAATVGCIPASQTEPPTYVDLKDLQPLPTPIAGETPLRVAVAAIISPKGTVESYTALLDYLGEKTGRPVELIQRSTYMEINDLIERGEIDVAFVCTSAYIAGQRDFGMELLAAPQVNGVTVYHAYLIVPADSPAQNMADLKGKVFAFTDPISLTGRAYPTYMLQQLGAAPEKFFARTFFTYSHDEAIYAVANGLADGASVDGLVYDYAVARDPSLADKVHVIHTSPPFGIPPVVVNPNLRPQVKLQLQTILLEMQNDPQGLAALQAIGVDRFVLVDDSIYESARSFLGEVTLSPFP